MFQVNGHTLLQVYWGCTFRRPWDHPQALPLREISWNIFEYEQGDGRLTFKLCCSSEEQKSVRFNFANLWILHQQLQNIPHMKSNLMGTIITETAWSTERPPFLPCKLGTASSLGELRQDNRCRRGGHRVCSSPPYHLASLEGGPSKLGTEAVLWTLDCSWLFSMVL